MSVPEFRLWQAFDRHHEPFGREWEQVYRIIVALGVKNKDGSVVREEQVTPLIPAPMTPEQLAARVRMMVKRQQPEQ